MTVYYTGTRSTYDLKSGMLFPDKAQVWQIIEVNPVPETEWTDEDRKHVAIFSPTYQARNSPRYLVVRPLNAPADPVAARKLEQHLRTTSPFYGLPVYPDEHYPICGTCGEPEPCREVQGIRQATQAMKRMERYETPGICPSCGEVVTLRQKALTFPVNLVIPGGPPVTFHIGRAACRYSAEDYERKIAGLPPAPPAVIPLWDDLG